MGCQGIISDEENFKNTDLHKGLETRTLNIPSPSVLQISYGLKVACMPLGGSAFTLNEFSMNPFQGNRYPLASLDKGRSSLVMRLIALHQFSLYLKNR